MAKNASTSKKIVNSIFFYIVTALILIKLHKTAVTCSVLTFLNFSSFINIIHPIVNEKTVTTIESSSQEGFRLIIGFTFIPFNGKASKCLKTLKFILIVFSPFLSLILNHPRDGREGACVLCPHLF